MRNPPEQDLSALSIDELMQGLDEQPPAASTPEDTWIKSEGYYPGSTKIPISALYANYLEFLKSQPGSPRPLGIRAFGKVLSSHFRRGRTNKESYYYISRESLSVLTAKLTKSALGTQGG